MGTFPLLRALAFDAGVHIWCRLRQCQQACVALHICRGVKQAEPHPPVFHHLRNARGCGVFSVFSMIEPRLADDLISFGFTGPCIPGNRGRIDHLTQAVSKTFMRRSLGSENQILDDSRPEKIKRLRAACERGGPRRPWS